MEMVRNNGAHKILKVQGTNISFQALAPDLFSLINGKTNFKSVYLSKDLDSIAEQTASGIFSLMNLISAAPPIMKIFPSEVTGKVASALTKLYQKSVSNKKTASSQKEKPLLIVLDRNSDLHTQLYHSWTYLVQIGDVFGPTTNNQFYYTDTDAQSGQKTTNSYSLDFSDDFVLKQNAFKMFHEAAENVDKELN